MRSFLRSKLFARVVLLTLVVAAVAAGRVCAEVDPWAAGSTWLSVRAGLAKNAVEGSGNAGAGFGFGASRMLGPTPIDKWKVFGRKPLGWLQWTFFKDFSIGGYVHYDVLGRRGAASEIEIPATVELVRHFRFKTAPRAYFGVGGGPFYRKTYHTGSDQSFVSVGGYATTGVNMVVAPNQLLGVDIRLARVDGRNEPASPVFGSGEGEASHWSIKLNYAVAY